MDRNTDSENIKPHNTKQLFVAVIQKVQVFWIINLVRYIVFIRHTNITHIYLRQTYN